MIPGFSDHIFEDGDVRIAYSAGGEGPPLLLLHGFPQTWRCGPGSPWRWRGISPSSPPICAAMAVSGTSAGVEEMSFRAMAADQLALMALGFDRFHLAGHDRGARTAHRMALDA
ncbi:MAG: hypothetical protein R3D85_09885 [Paracoccaceae bacterium]